MRIKEKKKIMSEGNALSASLFWKAATKDIILNGIAFIAL